MSGRTPNDDAWLDALLEAPDPYLPDDGFTERVVARLPAPRPAGRRRALLHLGFALLAGVIFFVVGGGATLTDFLTALSTLEARGTATMWVAVAMVVGLAWMPLTLALESE